MAATIQLAQILNSFIFGRLSKLSYCTRKISLSLKRTDVTNWVAKHFTFVMIRSGSAICQRADKTVVETASTSQNMHKWHFAAFAIM